jgi:hypothetical protein
MTELRQGTCIGLLLAVFWDVGLSYPAQSSQSARPEEPGRKTEGQGNRKKVYTNEDLIQLRDKHKEEESSSSTPVTPSHSILEAKGKGTEKGMSLSGYRDVNGHDREYWRKKIKPQRAQLESLNSEISSVQQRQANVGTAGGIRVSREGHLKTTSKDSQQDLSRKLADLERKRGVIARSIQDLEEEARKAQALPEWLR